VLLTLLVRPKNPSAAQIEINYARTPQQRVQVAIALAVGAWAMVIGVLWWLLQ
jgi:hypothetical protein